MTVYTMAKLNLDPCKQIFNVWHPSSRPGGQRWPAAQISRNKQTKKPSIRESGKESGARLDTHWERPMGTSPVKQSIWILVGKGKWKDHPTKRPWGGSGRSRTKCWLIIGWLRPEALHSGGVSWHPDVLTSLRVEWWGVNHVKYKKRL